MITILIILAVVSFAFLIALGKAAQRGDRHE